jgi:outer membrane protein insertion porin family
VSYRHRRYWPLTDDIVFSANAEIGYGDAYGGTSRLPFWETFYAGGPRSVRGFEARSLGPRDSEGDPIGGNATYYGTFELLFPPPFNSDSETVRMSTFVDYGAVLDTRNNDFFDSGELRYSTGIGFSWLSPVGALTVSYAVPFGSDSQDEEEEFQFTFGSTF